MDILPLKETDKRLTFAFRYWIWWLVTPIFGGLIFLIPPMDGAQIFPQLFLGFFALLGAYGALQRQDLVLDLATRRYKLRHGQVGFLKILEGPISDLGAVSLVREWRSHRGHNKNHRVEAWLVRLTVPDLDEAVDIGMFYDERKAYGRAEHYAEALDLPFVDATAEIAGIAGSATPMPHPALSPTDIDVSRDGVEPPTGVGDPGPPPPGSRISLSGLPGGRTVTLPPQGYSGPVLVPVILGVAMTQVGIASAFYLPGLIGSIQLGDVDGKLVGFGIAAVAALLGLYLIFSGVTAASRGIDIRETPDRMLIGKPLTSSSHHEAAYKDIDRIDLVPQALHGPEIFVKTRRQIFHFGSGLDESGRTWLLKCLRHMVSLRS